MRAVLFYILACFVLAVSCTGDRMEGSTAKPDSLPILITKIQTCSRLYTTEYHVHKIITHDDELTFNGTVFGHSFNWKIPAGSRKVAIPMYATLKGFIDFSGFSSDNVIRDSTHIEIILPDPQVLLTSSQIDHQRVVDRVAFLRSRFSDQELSNFERQGRQSIIESIPKLDIHERTRASAARLLVPILKQFGYREEDITISFRKALTPDSIHVIDRTDSSL